MNITPELRAFAIEQAGRRCECTGNDCRHHLRGSRCKRGLRGADWKVYWRSESGGATRDNIEAWCPECFGNNFVAPSETVALLALEIAGYARLYQESERKAITLKSVLRDVAKLRASDCGGRVVFDRLEDDILVEFRRSDDGVKAARSLETGFREMTVRLDLPPVELCGALHCGKITRWRNGNLAGDAVETTTTVRNLADVGQILVTDAAATSIKGQVELESIPRDDEIVTPPVGGLWVMRF